MKCYICNATLANDEIKHNPKYGHGDFDPCGTCLGVIGEIFEPVDENEMNYIILNELGDGEDIDNSLLTLDEET